MRSAALVRFRSLSDLSDEFFSQRRQYRSLLVVQPEIDKKKNDHNIQMSIAGGTRKEVSRSLLEKALKIPGFEFIDSSGRKWSNKSYFEMLARTELMNAARSSYDDKCAEEGFDVMRLTTSGNCCEKCARFEGELFSLTGATKGLPTKADLEEAGVFHPNCTHSYSLVPDYRPAESVSAGDADRPDGGSAEEPPPKARRASRKERETRERLEKYDETRDKFYQELLERGGSKEVAGALADAYTPEVAKFGPPPGVGFRKSIETACYHPDIGIIDLDLDASSWHGHPYTAAHEFGHWLDHHTRLQKAAEVKKFNAAAARDWKLLQKKAGGKLDAFQEKGSYWNELSQAMFGMPKSSLNLVQRKILTDYADTVASITDGDYGFGHDKEYFTKLVRNNKEAFANIFAAYVRNDKQFQLDFPNMTKYIKEMIEGGTKE